MAAESNDASTPPSRPRRREALLITVLAVAFAILAVLQTRLPEFSNASSLTGNIIFFLLINLNLVLLVVLVFLVARNLGKLIFERRQRILGARLRTRLVIAFVSLTLFPTMLLFVVAEGFLSEAINNWFDVNVQNALSNSLRVAHRYYQRAGDDALHFALEAEQRIRAGGLADPARRAELEQFLAEKRAEWNVQSLALVDAQGEVAGAHADVEGARDLGVRESDLVTALGDGLEFTRTLKTAAGELVRGGVPLADDAGTRRYVVIVDFFVPRAIGRIARATARSHDEYRQLQVLKQPIVNSYTLTLLLVALVVLFAATWFAFTFSKGFAVPIRRLGEGMREVAQGNWDYRAEAGGDEEFASLFTSFNQMAAELKNIHSELEERRRYIERVLSNITAGVLSIDDRGVIAAINPAAGTMLGLSPDNSRGRDWRQVLDRADLAPLRELLSQAASSAGGQVARQVQLQGGPRALTAWVSAVALSDEEGRPNGLILFLEDVSHLLRVERMEAWREVARRIAHEIKNPLTPIQLSAQRLHKRLDSELGPERRAILEECTATIVGQVEQLKKLVNEFSNFARLPAVELAPGDLGAVAEEALALFRDAHPEVEFASRFDPALPPVDLDREAVRRAVINLLDNAVSACQAQTSPRVSVSVAHDRGMSVVRLEVADNGPGIAADVRARVFEPYFSTKKDGTGLGLAIVSAIVSEHQGYIRLADAEPHGTRVIAEFPTRRHDRLRATAH